ncbi:MAG: ABC transporter ATP-binding protein [Acidobacteria bacterium]|nr:ABC transporter ATP-binding protein [Acidobacteriota bacterium]MBK7934302.1 ABC transporter ATP-binding protein [Acidobacteriota bacterium]
MALKIEKLSKRYDNRWALRDVELDVAEGEIFGIFGGTASGKTALLRVIAGIEKPNGGSVNFDGNGISFAEIEQPSGVTSLFRRKKSDSSSGEERIAAFRNSIAEHSGLILLDEPFCGIDAVERDRLINELQTAKQNGSTVIFASNDFEQIAAVCDRVAVLVKGEVAQIGFPQEVYENPASSAVAAIVGRNNLFTARRLTSTNADLPEFQTIEGSHRIVAQPTEKAALGAINQNVTLAIRPEQVSISFEASFPEDNILKAVVTAIRFLGPTTIIELDANGLRLESRVFRIVGLTVGEQCMIAMPPHRIQVLKN